MAYRTSQEKIDSLTMQINNPNVVGSGYIEHPPQVPFGGKLLMQPLSAVDGKDNPEWMNVAPRVPQATQYQQSYQHSASRNGRLEHSHAVAGHRPKNLQSHNAVPSHESYSRPPLPLSDKMAGRQQISQRDMPNVHQQGNIIPQHFVHGTGPRHQTGVNDAATLMNAPGSCHLNNEIPVAMQKSGTQGNDMSGVDESKKLTKSQKAKLRKKLREGKA